MAKPTFVNSYPGGTSSSTGTANWSGFNNDAESRTTSSFSVLAGDILVVFGGAEASEYSFAAAGPTGGSLSWTLQENVGTTGNFGRAQAWTATVDSNKTMTVTLTNDGSTGGRYWGMVVYHFRGSDGIGAAESSTGTGVQPSRTITTTAANSALVYLNTDWNAADGTTRTWRTVNSITPTSGNSLERVYFRDSAHYTIFSAYWDDAGAIGSKTVGLSAPGSQNAAMIAIEVKGSSLTNKTIVAETAAYTLTGSPATFRKTHKVIADSTFAAYFLTGSDATPSKIRGLTAEPGTYTLTGADATLTAGGGESEPLSFRSIATIAYGAGITTTVSKPTGTVDGDILLAAIVAGDPLEFGTDTTAPAGWTEIGTATSIFAFSLFVKLRLYWKRAASEGADYTWTHGDNCNIRQGAICAYSGGIASGNPVDAFSNNSATSGTSITGTGITTTVDNAMLVNMSHNWDATTTLSPPTGMTERFDSFLYVADESRATAGATGNRVQTGASSAPWGVFLVALKPASTAGGTDAEAEVSGQSVSALTATETLTVTGTASVSITTDPLLAATNDVSTNVDVRIPSLVPINPAAFLPFLVR